MPRIHITIQDMDEIDELEQQEDWEERLGLTPTNEARDVRSGMNGRIERRLGGSEARDRRNSERRKHVYRGGKR